jgi:thiol-disulfide isomerase/thioredoxin
VRAAAFVALVTVCLGLAGCSLFGKKHAAQSNKSKPFLGSSSAPEKAETAAMPRDSGGPLPNANGVLAGQVLVESTGRPARAFILVKNLEEEDAKDADLNIETVSGGYFTIPGLKPGQQYLLIARAEEDGQLISAKIYAKPPQPTLLFRLDKRWTDAKTPRLPNIDPRLPGKKNTADAENGPQHKPAVSIDAPHKIPDQEPQRGGIGGPPQGTGSVNPANIADNGGFRTVTPPSDPTVTIPTPPPPPPQPQWDNVPNQAQPARPAPGVPGSVRLPILESPVPSCGLYGNHLDNFALRDLDGKAWEYKRDFHGRLLLLDFWYSTCSPCLAEIHKLVELQRDYRNYGLEVVGIACETGTLEEQRQKVLSVRGRHHINYTTLLCGGGPERCPVVGQFQVAYYPLLVLIDSQGTILWRSTRAGMDENENYRLRKRIDDYLVSRQTRP